MDPRVHSLRPPHSRYIVAGSAAGRWSGADQSGRIIGSGSVFRVDKPARSVYNLDMAINGSVNNIVYKGKRRVHDDSLMGISSVSPYWWAARQGNARDDCILRLPLDQQRRTMWHRARLMRGIVNPMYQGEPLGDYPQKNSGIKASKSYRKGD